MTTWYLLTNLPRPDSPQALDSPLPPADLAEVVRLDGLPTWGEQSYKQVKQELGWADFMVRSDRAIRRPWLLVYCAFSFGWRAWFAAAGQPALVAPVPVTPEPAAPEAGENRAPTTSAHSRRAPWPLTLRRVRRWLVPWTFLRRWWRAWSTALPPPELQALLEAVGQGHSLNLSVLH